MRSEYYRQLKLGETYYYYKADNPVRTSAVYTTVNRDDIFVDENNLIHCKINTPAFGNAYFWHGKLHRTNGPALTIDSGLGPEVLYYFLHGKFYTKEDYDRTISNIKEENLSGVIALNDLF